MGTSPKTGDLELGRKIAARRAELGLSRKDLAQLTDLSYPYIAQIETGYRLPSSRHQISLARALGMTLDELFGTQEELRPERSSRGGQSGRSSIDAAVEAAIQEVESLPASVRLEALTRIQLQVMRGVTEAEARRLR